MAKTFLQGSSFYPSNQNNAVSYARFPDLVKNVSSIAEIRDRTYKFLENWYQTNGEMPYDVSWIDKMVEEHHHGMKLFLEYAKLEAHRNPDNSFISELRLVLLANVVGLAGKIYDSSNGSRNEQWYIKSAIHFVSNCFFGEYEDSEKNSVSLQNHTLREQLECVTDISINDIDLKSFYPLISKAIKNVEEESRLEKRYSRFNKFISR